MDTMEGSDRIAPESVLRADRAVYAAFGAADAEGVVSEWHEEAGAGSSLVVCGPRDEVSGIGGGDVSSEPVSPDEPTALLSVLRREVDPEVDAAFCLDGAGTVVGDMRRADAYKLLGTAAGMCRRYDAPFVVRADGDVVGTGMEAVDEVVREGDSDVV